MLIFLGSSLLTMHYIHCFCLSSWMAGTNLFWNLTSFNLFTFSWRGHVPLHWIPDPNLRVGTATHMTIRNLLNDLPNWKIHLQGPLKRPYIREAGWQVDNPAKIYSKLDYFYFKCWQTLSNKGQIKLYFPSNPMVRLVPHTKSLWFNIIGFGTSPEWYSCNLHKYFSNNYLSRISRGNPELVRVLSKQLADASAAVYGMVPSNEDYRYFAENVNRPHAYGQVTPKEYWQSRIRHREFQAFVKTESFATLVQDFGESLRELPYYNTHKWAKINLNRVVNDIMYCVDGYTRLKLKTAYDPSPTQVYSEVFEIVSSKAQEYNHEGPLHGEVVQASYKVVFGEPHPRPADAWAILR